MYRLTLRLTEELLTSDTQESVLIVQSLIFERIRPLLVLRILAISAFQSSHVSNEQLLDLSSILQTRILSNIEFEQVRKLSAEALAKLPSAFSFPIITHSLSNSINNGDLIASKYALFSLCSHFAFYESNIILSEQKKEVSLDEVIPLLFGAFNFPSGDHNCFPF